MSAEVFFDKELQKTFDREGVISIPFLNEAEIQSLLSFYQETSGNLTDLKFHSTMFINNPSYRKRTDEHLRNLLMPKINETLKDFRLLFANFITKESSKETAVGIHQDWNFTSPELVSLNIWIPLVDINEKTGYFYALKGSHHVFKNIRYTPYENNFYAELENYIHDNSSPFSVKAGSAVIYNGAVVHFSDPNISGSLRIAVGCALIPQSATNLHYYRRSPAKKNLEVYSVNEEFYQGFNFFEAPNGVKKTAEISGHNNLPTLDELTSTRMSRMRRIFFDDNLEREISERGYIVVKQLASSSTCDSLSQFFAANDSVDHRPFSISNWNNNADYRTKTYHTIVQSLLPLSKKYLQDYKPVMGVFTAKRPAEKSDMLLHQDWSLVDENVFRSVSVWVALCDMNNVNGNLQVAEYSHIYAGTPRGMNMPIPFENLRQEIHKHFLTDIPLKKGDAIIFDHRLIHASPMNKSNEIRLAAVMALIPAEAELIHYYKYEQDNQSLELLKMKEDEFHLVDFFDMPNKPKHTEVLKTIPAEFRQIGIEEIQQFSVA